MGGCTVTTTLSTQKTSMKYVALTLSAAATALLVVVLGGIAQKMGADVRVLPPPQVSLNPLSEQQRRDQADVRHALQALEQVATQHSMELVGSGDADGHFPAFSSSLNQGVVWAHGDIFALSPLVAPLAEGSRNRVSHVGFATATPLPLPNVSVVLSAGAEGKAVINGHLVRVGDTVAEGLVVKSIQVDVVTFASGSEELHVRMPLERLRVLGAFPNQVRGN